MKTKILTTLFFITGILFIILEDHQPFLTVLILKTLIIPLLILIMFVNRRPSVTGLDKLMFAGLFFSWAGDIVLELPGTSRYIFMSGLALFLLAHIVYLTVFFKTPGKNLISVKRIWLLLPFIFFGAGLVSWLYADLGNMRLPVILYTIIILTMVTGAVNRYGKVNHFSYWMVLFGAILFVISDSAIAINKFGHHFESSGTVVMSTYIAAQFLIVIGYIREFRGSFV